jgi:hypothetical protein
LMTTAALLILRTIFPFMYMNPQHRRLCVGLCRMLILFAIYFKHLPLLMNSPGRCHGVFAFFLLTRSIALTTCCNSFIH